eukprot:NODE_2926_length_479_cov_48.250000_g2876_i0.p1 GENE.NODE_2926_length_479_cov_48.250000_g2876_i0~~NODE_2926_length_479_cov_48.250000_g2876_i0.p1  ORF type:complete len:100 (+),score=15.30 NODE_2926_length_479_cov_48.250000_g2876_i0:76-375(+)
MTTASGKLNLPDFLQPVGAPTGCATGAGIVTVPFDNACKESWNGWQCIQTAAPDYATLGDYDTCAPSGDSYCCGHEGKGGLFGFGEFGTVDLTPTTIPQ